MPGKAVSHHTGKSPDGTVVSFLIPRIRLVTDIRLGITVETPAFKKILAKRIWDRKLLGSYPFKVCLSKSRYLARYPTAMDTGLRKEIAYGTHDRGVIVIGIVPVTVIAHTEIRSVGR